MARTPGNISQGLRTQAFCELLKETCRPYKDPNKLSPAPGSRLLLPPGKRPSLHAKEKRSGRSTLHLSTAEGPNPKQPSPFPSSPGRGRVGGGPGLRSAETEGSDRRPRSRAVCAGAGSPAGGERRPSSLYQGSPHSGMRVPPLATFFRSRASRSLRPRPATHCLLGFVVPGGGASTACAWVCLCPEVHCGVPVLVTSCPRAYWTWGWH